MAEENLPVVATPQELMGRAGSAAAACKAIVSQTAVTIQGKKYVRVEGWQAIAIAHGCVASARDVEDVGTGWKAIGEVRRMDTGAVIATGEGFVGKDERTWSGRAEYANRAMCQTRAISRACRSAFAHVVVMMNAGLETTPAEEIPDDHHVSRPAQTHSEKPAAVPSTEPKPVTDQGEAWYLERIGLCTSVADVEKIQEELRRDVRDKVLLASLLAQALKAKRGMSMKGDAA